MAAAVAPSAPRTITGSPTTRSLPRHPDDEIAVRAELVNGTVRIEVSDPGRDGSVEVRQPGARGGGYGLFLVDRLTNRWGVDRHDGTTVWAELSAGPSR